MSLNGFFNFFKRKQYQNGLVLGGGGTRGFAHLGVIQALEERGISIDAISGVSAGAIIGAFIASGMTPNQVMEILVDHKLLDFTKIRFPKKGLMDLSKLGNLIDEHLGQKSFEDLNLPLWVTLSNLNKGGVEYHNEGNLVKKVLASASIPMLFSPVDIDGTTYVDGGLFDNLPVKPIEKQCKQIIGVNISPVDEIKEFKNVFEIAARTFQLNDKSNTRKNSKLCSIYIEPPDLCNYGLLDIENASRLFEIGYEYTLKMNI